MCLCVLYLGVLCGSDGFCLSLYSYLRCISVVIDMVPIVLAQVAPIAFWPEWLSCSGRCFWRLCLVGSELVLLLEIVRSGLQGEIVYRFLFVVAALVVFGFLLVPL